MVIITKKSLKELNESGISCNYAVHSKGRDFLVYSTGKTYGEAFDNFASLLEEGNYDGVCEVKISYQHQDKGLVSLVGKIISLNKR